MNDEQQTNINEILKVEMKRKGFTKTQIEEQIWCCTWRGDEVADLIEKGIKKERTEIMKAIESRCKGYSSTLLSISEIIAIIKLRSKTSTVVKPELHSKARK